MSRVGDIDEITSKARSTDHLISYLRSLKYPLNLPLAWIENKYSPHVAHGYPMIVI